MTACDQFNKPDNEKYKIIVAPLDWGLGHAARCIPLIEKLLRCDYEVIIAAENAQRALLQEQFPHLLCLPLRGYRLTYGSTAWLTIFKIILQIPKILTQIKREKQWLRELLLKNPVDAVIADNRFGFCSPETVSILMTHQLSIRTPFGKSVENKLQGMNYRYLRQFSLCWVPDTAGGPALAGALSHPEKFPTVPVRYIGWLSRFQKMELPKTSSILFLLSGPEPQRTILERIILSELKCFPRQAVLVRGLPAETSPLQTGAKVEAFNHLPTPELNRLICACDLVICRSGYSTLMDLAKLGKKSIVIPTPGQAEQEYLATYWHEQKWALKMEQHRFSLVTALAAAAQFPFQKFQQAGDQDLDLAIDELTTIIRAARQR